MANSEAFPAGIGYPVGQTLDPLGMLKSAGDLVNPAAAARQLPWLASELLDIALGRSGIEADERDPRFADVTWRANPFFHALARSYRLFEEWTDRMADAPDVPWDVGGIGHPVGPFLEEPVRPCERMEERVGPPRHIRKPWIPLVGLDARTAEGDVKEFACQPRQLPGGSCRVYEITGRLEHAERIQCLADWVPDSCREGFRVCHDLSSVRRSVPSV